MFQLYDASFVEGVIPADLEQLAQAVKRRRQEWGAAQADQPTLLSG